MKIHHLSIVILLISGLALGMMNYLTDLGTGYSTEVDLSQLNNTQSRLIDQQQTMQSLSNNITGFTLEITPTALFDIPYKLTQIAWNIARTIFGTWSILGTMVEEVGTGLTGNDIFIPNWVIPTLMAMLIITLVAIVLYAFFKWEWKD